MLHLRDLSQVCLWWRSWRVQGGQASSTRVMGRGCHSQTGRGCGRLCHWKPTWGSHLHKYSSKYLETMTTITKQTFWYFWLKNCLKLLKLSDLVVSSSPKTMKNCLVIQNHTQKRFFSSHKQ